MEDYLDSPLALQEISADDEEGIQKLEGVVKRFLAAGEQQRRPFAVQAFSNISYLLGNHMVQFFFSPSTGFGLHRFGVHDNSKYDSLLAKSADNRLPRAVESVVAMLTSQDPEPRMEPNSQLPEDEDAAALAELAVKAVWEYPLRMPELLREAASLACTTHLVAAEVEYTETDDPVEVPRYKDVTVANPLYEEGDPEDQREFQESVQDGFEVGYRRDVRCRLWTSFNLTFDPAATSARDATWIARTSIEDIEWVARRYARKAPGYRSDEAQKVRDLVAAGSDVLSESGLYWWGRIRDIIESPQYYGYGLAAREKCPGQCLLTVIDVKPCKEYPRGRTLVFAGQSMLYGGDARAWSEQYPWRWHPYSFFGWFSVPGRLLRIPLLSLLLPLQKKINAIDALVQANRQYMAFGQYWLPKSAKVEEGRISGFPGEHFTYTDNGTGVKPERVQNAPLPQELLIERQELIQAIDYHAGVWVTPEGQIAPSANRAAAMLDRLRQERLQSKQPMLREFESFVEGIAQNILIELQLNLIAEDPELTRRMQMLARDYSQMTIQSFTGLSLRDHHSIKMDVSSALLNTPDAEAERALQFFQFAGGQVTAPERAAILKATKLDRLVHNPDNASVERARRVISRVRTGQLTEVMQMPGESAGAMLPVFVDEILSDRFHDLTDEQKNVLLAYQQTYQAIVQQQQMQALQIQMVMAQAGVKNKGASSGPGQNGAAVGATA